MEKKTNVQPLEVCIKHNQVLGLELNLVEHLCKMNLSANEYKVFLALCYLSWGKGEMIVNCTNYHIAYITSLDVKKVSTAINRLITRNMLLKTEGISKDVKPYEGKHTRPTKEGFNPPYFIFKVNRYEDTWINGLKIL